MPSKSIFLAAVCSLTLTSAFTQQYKTIIDTSKGIALLKQCSRSVPENITGFWKIENKDVELISNNINNLKNSVDPGRFAYQLVGVLVNGEKYIYANALVLPAHREINEEYKNWQTIPLVVCDGGKDYWGVLFKPSDKSFSNLAFNRGE